MSEAASKTRSNLSKVCPQCNTERPNAQFPALPLDKRCEFCLPLHEAERIEERRMKRIEEKVANLIDAAKGDVVDVPRFDRLLSAFIRDGGGINQISLRMWRLIDRLENKRSESAALHFLGSMIKRWIEQEKQKHDQDMDKLDRKEVAEQRKLLMLQILTDMAKDKASAELLADLAEASGVKHLLPQVVEPGSA